MISKTKRVKTEKSARNANAKKKKKKKKKVCAGFGYAYSKKKAVKTAKKDGRESRK